MLNEGGIDGALEKICPVALIREHIADDDTERFSDTILAFQRRAAFEACHLYTGIDVIRQTREMIETKIVRMPYGGAFGTPATGVPVRLKFASADGVLTITNGAGAYQQTVPPGSRSFVYRPKRELAPYSCVPEKELNEISVSYRARTGFAYGEIPAGLVLGALKVIAWSVQHPGDQLTTVPQGRATINVDQLAGTNNGMVASGAMDEWRRYLRRVSW